MGGAWMKIVFLNTCWNGIQGMGKKHEGGKEQPGSAALKIWRWSQEELE